MSKTEGELLSVQHPEWGTVALIPWDTDHFGFPVATWTLPPNGLSGADPGQVNLAVCEWATRTGSRLVSVPVAGTDLVTVFILQAAGFRVVDYALKVRLPRLQAVAFAVPALPVRDAEAADHDEVTRIAGTAFKFGGITPTPGSRGI